MPKKNLKSNTKIALIRTIDKYTVQAGRSINFACGLFGKSRQIYYRRKKREDSLQVKASIAIKLVEEIRGKLPRVRTRKLHYMLNVPLKKINIGKR